MIKAKSKMIEPSSEAAASEVFAIADNIIPIRQASVETILNTDFTEEMEVVPHTQVKRLIVENRNTNPVSKFFVKVGNYLDSLENFLIELNSNYIKSVEQKKSILESEKADQLLRTHRAKKTAKKVSDKRRAGFDLGKVDDDTLFALAAALGLETADRMSGVQRYFKNLFTDKTIHKDVVREGDFAVEPGTNVADPPDWIPFPVGTKGLTYTSGFGMRWGRPHQGIDIAGPTGTPIITPINGMVDVMGSLSGYGKAVYIKSGNLLMEFGHLDSINVKEIGQEVKAGSVIGTLGSTGRSTGPHLHWTIRMNGAAVDPVEWTKSNPPLSSTSHFKATTELGPLEEGYGKESEGGINYHRIMVGEAGPEFVIPMSQMPIFGQLMMEEKIKSINPYYQVPYNRFRDIGFERQSGIGTPMASGGIAAAKPFIKKHEALGAFVPGTGGGNFLADYIGEDMSESIKGTPRSEAYKPSTKLHSYIDSEDVDTIGYGTTFYDNIFSGRNAVGRGDTSTVGKMESTMGRHVKEIDEKYDKEYPMYKYLKPQQQAGIISYLYNRGPNAILFHGPSDRALSSGNIRALAQLIQEDTESVGPKRRKEEADLIRSGPLQVVGPAIVGRKKVGEKEVGSGIPLIPDLTIQKMIQSLGNQSSLNSIPDNKQMEIASETQEEFSFGNSKGEIVALFKPTVHYSDPA